MMRVGTLLAVVSVLFLGMLGVAADGPKTMIGFSLPTVGFVNYDESGNITSVTGLNLALGFSARYFFNGLQPNRFNGYWGWGTLVLILPYFEIGTAYAFPVGGGDQYIVLDIGLLYIVPYIGLSVYF